jgi:mono/diheme cytochrome c family protein
MNRTHILVLLIGLSGCVEQSMEQQNRLDTYAPSKLFSNGSEAQLLPEGAVAQGATERAQAVRVPPPVTKALLASGREHYEVFCAPCHGLTGQGDGIIVQRGFPAPPSYHLDRLRKAPAQHFFDVITSGYGIMYPYAARVPPRDRWAIVAYIRALQESRFTKLADMPEARAKLP